MQGYLRQMTQDDLNLVLEWRNHPDTRKYMFSQHKISPEEHAQWFDRLGRDNSQTALLYIVNDVALGYVNFKKIEAPATANWGFHLNHAAPKGTGKQFGQTALNYAFEVIKLRKVCSQVLEFNEKSIKFHLNLGFQREETMQQQYFNGKNYYNIEFFRLLASEWTGGTQ